MVLPEQSILSAQSDCCSLATEDVIGVKVFPPKIWIASTGGDEDVLFLSKFSKKLTKLFVDCSIGGLELPAFCSTSALLDDLLGMLFSSFLSSVSLSSSSSSCFFIFFFAVSVFFSLNFNFGACWVGLALLSILLLGARQSKVSISGLNFLTAGFLLEFLKLKVSWKFLFQVRWLWWVATCHPILRIIWMCWGF